MTKLGVYAGHPQLVADFSNWLGRGVEVAQDFDAAKPSSDPAIASAWTGQPFKMAFSVPMDHDLAAGATGEHDPYFAAVAANLVAKGLCGATLRIGWEFNASWMPWRADVNPIAFKAYWRKIVTAMRSVPGAKFKFDWCTILGAYNIDPTVVYPGDAYVDYIGLDVYDTGGWPDATQQLKAWKDKVSRRFGLSFWSGFAAAHGKPISIPEWGLVQPEYGGCGDDVIFIEKMAKWIAANNVAYHCYFNTDASGYGLGDHRLAPNSMFPAATRYPAAANRYRELFR